MDGVWAKRVSLQCPPVLSRNQGPPPKGQNWEANLVLTHDPELSNPPGLELEGFMEPSIPRCCKARG